MATGFLQRALPGQGNRPPQVRTEAIRGNVDTRLQKLMNSEYDGIILACAGINRLLRADSARQVVSELLTGTRLMILPLLHCPPAPGQGAIVVETTRTNSGAIHLLKDLNHSALARAVDHERTIAHRYGSGCHQKFGVIHIDTPDQSFTFAAGKDRNDVDFNVCYGFDNTIFHITKKPGTLGSLETFFNDHNLVLAIGRPREAGRVWVSETSSWFDLAAQGIWVEGSVEGFGLEFIKNTIDSPLVSRERADRESIR
jgi:hypothetical protein